MMEVIHRCQKCKLASTDPYLIKDMFGVDVATGEAERVCKWCQKSGDSPPGKVVYGPSGWQRWVLLDRKLRNWLPRTPAHLSSRQRAVVRDKELGGNVWISDGEVLWKWPHGTPWEWAEWVRVFGTWEWLTVEEEGEEKSQKELDNEGEMWYN